mmetsp:Transcript_9617/g.16011  ORF Transcript_9617/g.16011 Transcript_9617/m.16011 type:complete len:544 (+) Transcript_9617:112-1743(+)|eukprot:CAMPEP_0119023730 /NCGR_PEP_ID=MMETSP1176-20130426/30542_1 /TAXON_ID=265551 /ORGANISM="Synedropsis recta cf, Strain CCMP1620" /LENGTH=543 /DNA_ID=CAMNT_0006978853 /DNA_START=94 /DNA_END=1725 /DNA_ORIENTATION=+
MAPHPPMDGPSEGATPAVVRPVSSLIATLPTAASLHRTIDQFYEEAHATMDKPPPQSAWDHSKVMGARLGYFCIFVALGLANVGDAAEIGSMGFLLANDDFRTEVVRGNDGLVAAALYLGMLFGGLIAGPLCDLTGRRNVLLYGLVLNSGFGVGAALSESAFQLILCRLFMGFGVGSIVSCLLALTSEHTPPRHRGFYLNFVSAFWTIGSIYVAALALILFGRLDRSWRLYVLANAVPSIVSLILVLCFVPESARFLAVHGNHERAAKVANRVASSMGYNGEKLKENEIRAHFPLMKDLPLQYQSSFRGGLSKSLEKVSSLYSSVSCGRTCGVQMLWFFVSFGSGMCLWVARVFSELTFVANLYTMTFFFSLASIPGVFVAGYVMDKMDRKKLLTVSLILTAVSLAAFGFLTLFTEMAWLIVLSACLFHCCLVVSWSVLSVVTAEIFPTTVRATAMGVCSSSGRLGSVLVHLISAPIVEYHNPSVLLFVGAGSFALAIITSIISNIQSKTGQPLQDLENPMSRENNLASGKNADKSGRSVARE